MAGSQVLTGARRLWPRALDPTVGGVVIMATAGPILSYRMRSPGYLRGSAASAANEVHKH